MGTVSHDCFGDLGTFRVIILQVERKLNTKRGCEKNVNSFLHSLFLAIVGVGRTSVVQEGCRAVISAQCHVL